VNVRWRYLSAAICLVLVVGIGGVHAGVESPQQSGVNAARAYVAYMQARLAELHNRYDDAERLYREALQHATSPGYIYYALGLLYRRTGRLEDAVRAFTQAVQHEPDLADAWRDLGQIYEYRVLFRQDETDIEKAIQAYMRYVELSPNGRIAGRLLQLLNRQQQYDRTIALGERYLNTIAQYTESICMPLYEAYRAKGDRTNAERTLRRYIQIAPTDPDAYRQYAEFLQEQNRLQEAIDILERGWQQKTDAVDLLEDLIRLLRRTRQYDRAMQIIDRAFQALPKNPTILRLKARLIADVQGPSAGIAFLDEHVDTTEASWETRVLRMFLLERAYRWRELAAYAQQLSEQLEAQIPPGNESRDELRTLILWNRATALARLGRYTDSLEICARERVRTARSAILEDCILWALSAGQIERARQWLDAAAVQFPNEPDRWQLLEVRWLEARGRLDDAETRLRARLEDRADAWIDLVEFYHRTHQYKKALDILQRRIDAGAEDVPTLFLWGSTLERLQRYAEAEQVFQKLLNRNPEHAPSLNYLGYMWADRGIHLEEAKRLIERALRVDPENPAYLDSLAWVYYKMGDPQTAWRWMQEVLRRESRDPIVLDHAGDIVFALGRKDEALRYWQSSLKAAEQMQFVPIDFRPDTVRAKIQKICPNCLAGVSKSHSKL